MTNNSIIIKRTGLVSLLSHGLKGDKEILISQISSVQFRNASGIINGYIQFAFIGGQEAKGGLMEATKDENTVMFQASQQADFENFRSELQNRITRPSEIKPSVTPGLDELEKLASLRDKNIITDEEFQAKKRQILGL
jgi:hypothetical protein